MPCLAQETAHKRSGVPLEGPRNRITVDAAQDPAQILSLILAQEPESEARTQNLEVEGKKIFFGGFG